MAFGMCICILSLVFLSTVYGISLRRRLGHLQLQMDRNSLQTRQDIMELREMISSLNSTEAATRSVGTDDIQTGVSYNEFKELKQAMQTFMNEQGHINEALKNAFMDEKAAGRKMIKTMPTSVEQKTDKSLSVEEADKLFRTESQLRIHFDSQIWAETMAIVNYVRGLQARLARFESVITIESSQYPDYNLRCPSNWAQYYNNCYYLYSNETVSWHTANSRCQNYGGILAELVSKGEMLFVSMKIAEAKSDRNIWLGGTDEKKEGTWMWVSSKQHLSASLWAGGQPNNFNGTQHCLETRSHGRIGYNDENCSEKNYFMCQKQLV